MARAIDRCCCCCINLACVVDNNGMRSGHFLAGFDDFRVTSQAWAAMRCVFALAASARRCTFRITAPRAQTLLSMLLGFGALCCVALCFVCTLGRHSRSLAIAWSERARCFHAVIWILGRISPAARCVSIRVGADVSVSVLLGGVHSMLYIARWASWATR